MPSDSSPTGAAKGRILVIDDNPQNLALIEAQLGREGFAVTIASSGQVGLEAAAEIRPDVILLDILMPGMDGYEVCRQLKAGETTRYIPVVMLTALRERPDKLRALEAGADDFLTKPVDRADLLARIRAFLRMKLLYDELAEKRDEIAEQAAQLRESEARSRLLFANTPLPTWVYDLQSLQFLEVNEAAVVHYGYSREEFLRMRITDIRPPDRGPGLRQEMGRERPSTNTSGSWRDRRKDGELFEVNVVSHGIELSGRRAILEVAEDITERSKAEEERNRLMAETERNRATLLGVMGSMSDGLLVVDADRRVRYCNLRAAEMLDCDSVEVVGELFENVMDALLRTSHDPVATQAVWDEALARMDERPSIDVSIVGPPQRDILIHPFPVLDGRGARLGHGVALRDVTAERDLSRTKDELVAVVSHELRTPLASLLGFPELLLARDFPESERREYLTLMLHEGRRLTALVNDFLDLQRMESGSQQFRQAPTSLYQILQQVVFMAGEDLKRPIVLDLPNDLPLVRADEDHIKQVLVTLSNARKYSPAGGTVRLTARPIDGAVEVSVRDNGLGLPPDALPKLFEKFYRVDNSDRRAITGTGLGLAICRKIVDAHGGRIWAESAGLGTGARFAFTLPAAGPGRNLGDVLIVEDDANFARLLAAELQVRGMSATRVPSVEAAIIQVARDRPRAVLLDLLLPGVRGEALLRWLRQEAGLNVPVVVVTATDLDAETRSELGAWGVETVLRKGQRVASEAADAVLGALAAAQTRAVGGE